jgi:hypothetical protein
MPPIVAVLIQRIFRTLAPRDVRRAAAVSQAPEATVF